MNPQYLGPYEIVDRVGVVAYCLHLPPTIINIHNVFHVSQLKKYHPDPSHIISPDDISIEGDLSYVEKPIKILDQKIHQLRKKQIRQVKVLWRNHKYEEATWELEEDMRQQYPELFAFQGLNLGIQFS